MKEQDFELECKLERLALCRERLAQLETEELVHEPFREYFRKVAAFLLSMYETYEFLKAGGLKTAPVEELRSRNQAMYEDILPKQYGTSYANPDYAVEKLGEDYGQVLAALYYEVRSIIGFVFEQDLEAMALRMELFLEVYGCFVCAAQDGLLPKFGEIKDILYWYVSDYADEAVLTRTGELVTKGNSFAANIIEQWDLSEERYLYAYGEYISDNERAMAKFLAKLPQEIIDRMADTYTEGYRIGFEVGNKDLAKKQIVDIRYRVGFERMIKKAIENFRVLHLEPAIYRNGYTLLYHPSIYKNGYYGAEPNRQYDFDHKDDKALFFDKNYVNRRLEVSHTAFEYWKEQCSVYAGPAVVETFGEQDFEPVNKATALRMSAKQNALFVDFRTKLGELQRKYILEEERSFTIIAFPVPEIGEVFEELFRETIRINTLDYKKYQRIQGTLIQALDKADYCLIQGKGDNRTKLKVNLHKLENPKKETIFENCVADVNIPVGEVFTSPVLNGTEGVLHVTRVFLNGLEYKDLTLRFQNGMITEYSCRNFPTEEENKAFIKENVLFRQETLPLGEFAIGTNTTAYEVARRLGVEAKMPILIAEKMGPHFAVGDTCYSHAEEVRVYNPDGKEIVAKENECSLKRLKGEEGAYFNCHTDITIPYDELGSLIAVTKAGEEIPILQDGLFVLPGTEELNEPLNCCEK